ncbi:MAG TPA: M20/M25/M40 family metallo-hydrolase [Gemmatimonadota bacterium]
MKREQSDLDSLRVERDALNRTLAELVRINSINPAFGEGRTNEAEIAWHVAAVLGRLGMEVTSSEPEPGRVSVLGRLPGRGAGPSLMLYAHLDTVGVEGMSEPFSSAVRDGRMYGRGTYDMKGALAACITAIETLVKADRRPAGDLYLAAVADEEVASIGMSDVLTRVVPDAAIVTEATELRLCRAHKGFCWIEVETEGRAAHGSRFEEGVDANLRMGRFLGRLEGLERELRARAPHPLVGPPSLHAATLQGGTGWSTYAAGCRLQIERRTIPGESEAGALQEIQRIVDELAAADPSFRASVRPVLARESFEVEPDAPIVRSVASAAARVLGAPPPTIGEPYWMDAALLAAAGADVVIIGPRGAGAHAAVEWVDLESVAQVSEILALTAAEFGHAG